jgi:hypothetical protein
MENFCSMRSSNYLKQLPTNTLRKRGDFDAGIKLSSIVNIEVDLSFRLMVNRRCLSALLNRSG